MASDIIRDYDQLVAALRQVRHARGLSMMELEMISGLHTGYVAKLENWDADKRGKHYGRNIGPATLPLWLGGLDVGIVLVDLSKGRNAKLEGLMSLGG